jgi:23S rRNA pseudouridine2605 synthase
MSDNRDQKSRGPRKPDRAPKGGKPAGKSFAKSGDKPRGKPVGKPAGKSFDKPAGRSFDKPRDQSFEKPRGASFDKPRGKTFDKPRRVLRTPQVETPSAYAGERIAKVMARVGLCSRRDAELWISQGRVAVNGKKLDTPAVNVTPEDRITVDNKPLAERERTRLFMFHKPRGFVTTDRDPEGRPTIFDALPEGLPRLISIGRLDINTEGLLLLTNDGGLARVLELPSTGWLRRYRVRANGSTDQAKLDELRKGIVIEGIEYAGIEATLDRVQGANVWLSMGLREGKNREIKRVLEHLGLAVNRLIRLSYGPFQLGDLEDGAIDEVRTRVLMEQIGPVLSEEAGCDFNSPIIDRSGREVTDEIRPMRAAPRGKMIVPDEELGPRKDRPAPRTRKHVSVLRAAREEPKQERRRIERAETADRKGRAVKVERVTRPGKTNLDTRNGRRFADGGTDPRTRRDATAGERPRTGRNAKEAPRDLDRRGMRPRREDTVSEPREFKPWGNDPGPTGNKPERDFKRGDRPQRSGGKPTGKPPFKGGGKGPSKGPRKPRD